MRHSWHFDYRAVCHGIFYVSAWILMRKKRASEITYFELIKILITGPDPLIGWFLIVSTVGLGFALSLTLGVLAEAVWDKLGF